LRAFHQSSSSPEFAEHIETDELSVDEVVELIAARTGLDLGAGRLSATRYQLRRASVGIRHIRT
jgi:hypothetical protein